jgi:hypothetical protein
MLATGAIRLNLSDEVIHNITDKEKPKTIWQKLENRLQKICM